MRKTIYVKQGVKNVSVWLGGALVGGVSGFFGGGGGMLCVPLLSLCGLDAKRQHATALLVILPICIVSAVIYIHNGYFEPREVVCAVIGVAMGGVVGALALDKLSGTALSLIFAALMTAIGVKLVIA